MSHGEKNCRAYVSRILVREKVQRIRARTTLPTPPLLKTKIVHI